MPEPRISNPQVAGSNPAGRAKIQPSRMWRVLFWGIVPVCMLGWG